MSNPELDQLVWNQYMKTDFMYFMVRYAYLPPKEMEALAIEKYDEMFAEAYEEKLDPAVLRFHMHFWAMKRNHFGRSVQPIGSMPDLAPIVGAIRLKAIDTDPAKKALSTILIRALEENDDSTIEAIRGLFKCPLGDSPTYQVWLAIFEMIKSGNYRASRNLAKQGFILRFLPSTKELKFYVHEQRSRGRKSDFSHLPGAVDCADEDREWRKLRARIGLNKLLERGTRGTSSSPSMSGKGRAYGESYIESFRNRRRGKPDS